MSNETNFPIPPQPTVELHKLPPFPRFCCTIGMIPSSYKVGMSYEEQLMWLCEYMKETVIPTINENTNATNSVILKYNEIVDFLNHYFDNLDVQQEINNKLDEMAESGYFDNILHQYIDNSFIQYFDNVASLRLASLNEGQIVGTKGYYSPNDGGHSTFIVVDDNSLTDDSGSIIELANGLFAKILLTDYINVKQFGAKGDDLTNDSTSVTNAMNFAIAKNIPLTFTTGIYILNQSIHLNQYNKIIISGQVIIKTSASVGIKIDNITLPDTLDDNRMLNTTIIDTSHGNLILLGNNSNIGIGIGTDSSDSISYLNSYAFVNLNNIKIANCDIGIQLYLNRLYINSFDNLVIRKCRIGIETTNYSVDSSENMLFNHCVFAGCDICIDYKRMPGDFIFNSCSFDFFGILFNVSPSVLRYSNIVFNSCHIEGLGISSNTGGTIYNNRGLIVNNSTTIPINVNFKTCHFNFTTHDIDYNNIIRGLINLNIDMIFYYTFSNLYADVISTLYLCDTNVRIKKYNISWQYQYLYLPLSDKINEYVNGRFQLNTIGQSNHEMDIDNVFSLVGQSNTLITSIVADDIFTKALKIECNSESDIGVYASFNLGKIPIKAGQQILSSLLFKSNILASKNLVIPIYYYYYDINNNLIGSTPSGSARPQSSNNKYLHNNSYVRPGVGMYDVAPVGTAYCIPRIEFNAHMDSTEYVVITDISIITF